jgi:hypothetical protein
MHIDDNVLDEQGRIDPNKIDLVARMGADYYCRASGNAVFEVPKPNVSLGIGIDALPAAIRNSPVLTGNNLGILGNSTAIPSATATTDGKLLAALALPHGEARTATLHQYAKELLDAGHTDMAWQVLLSR